ncbi:MAG: hypothetical protein AB8B55_06615 [Mariniblastus sp.]
MLAQQSSSFLGIIENVNPEMLGAVMILGVIGVFIATIVTVVSICRTVSNISMLRMNHTFVKDLLKQGYSVDDIDRLVYGNQGWGRKLQQFVKNTKRQMSSARNEFSNRPAPPVKQPA